MKSAKVCQQSDPQGGVARHSVEGGWVLVNKKDVPHGSGAAAGRHAGAGPRMPSGSCAEEMINPLREHIDTKRNSS